MSTAASTNSLGNDGVKNQSIMGDYVLTVGNDANLNPATRVNAVGFETTREIMGSNTGAFQVNGTLPSYTPISTGAIHRTGNVNIFGGNQISLEAGSGGIEFATSGNVSINPMGGMLTVNAPATAEFVTGTLHLAGADGVVMDGGQCQNNFENNSFKNNVEFGTNLKLSGGLSCGGEAFIPHITTQKQKMTTDPAGETVGNINPCQSFTVACGSAKLSKIMTPLPNMITGGTPITPGWIPINIMLGIPGIPGMAMPLQVAVEGAIQFTKGIRLFSDNAFKNNPLTATMFMQSNYLKTVDGGDESDITGPSHTHDYYIGAADLLDSTAAVFDAAKACDSKDPVGPKEMQIGGSPMAEMKKFYTDMIKKRAQEQFVEPVKHQAIQFAKGAASSVGSMF